MYRDRNFSMGDFDKAVKYAVSKVGHENIYKPFDDKYEMVTNINDATEQDFGDAIYHTKMNFCTERINNVKAIGKKLYPVK
jgi:hypothetical protein